MRTPKKKKKKNYHTQLTGLQLVESNTWEKCAS